MGADLGSLVVLGYYQYKICTEKIEENDANLSVVDCVFLWLC
jgi:hypothetical protein